MLANRRELLALAARAAALPGGAEFMTAWLKAAETHKHAASSAPPEPALLRDYKPKFFDAADFEVLQAFTEILIPTDETPGAQEAHCAHYIDFLLQASDGVRAVQKQWRAALATLRESGFRAADKPGRERLVAEMSAPERDRSLKHAGFGVYQLIKQQNAFAFYTSRAGMIETLDYRGNSYNLTFPACEHPEHHRV